MKTIIELVRRIKTDKAFRQQVLTTRNEGFGVMSNLIAREGYDINVDELNIALPDVQTHLKAGERPVCRE